MICPSLKGSSSSAASRLGDIVEGSYGKRATKIRTSLSPIGLGSATSVHTHTHKLWVRHAACIHVLKLCICQDCQFHTQAPNGAVKGLNETITVKPTEPSWAACGTCTYDPYKWTRTRPLSSEVNPLTAFDPILMTKAFGGRDLICSRSTCHHDIGLYNSDSLMERDKNLKQELLTVLPWLL